ncbi:thiamine diphosphate-binding protein [Bombardia bombarda]|uniref:Pyruvate decarboxylase n=1 Tax=Bombardia bombarda TaxID=252184 RepID=A0AA39U2N6_9PEZI|nr:thiamine diphosphate-binding protein [Bombardia bombarda]
MAMDIRTSNLTTPVTVAEYLFTRLHQIGIRSAKLKWVGSVNELNAAYAADGYARIKGIGALITTFGIGELSALNGVAGAYSEHIPLVHIVGCPSTISQRNGMLLHHTLGNGDFHVFTNMSASISCEQAKLLNPAEIASQIDHALKECWVKSRPVYLWLPTDMVEKKVEGERLKTPVDLVEPKNDPEREDYVVDVVLKYLHAAKNPIILVDACAIRHRVLGEVQDLIDKTEIPVFVTPMGKGAFNESSPNYGGVYAGSGSHPDVAALVEGSDLVLSIGSLKSDFNTSGFSYRTSQLNTIDFHSTHCQVRYSEYPGVKMRGVLRKIADRVDVLKLSKSPMAKVENQVAQNMDDSKTITQAWFWPRLGEYLREGDIVVTETGTPNFGIWETKFPPGVTGVTQVFWGSIGWAVGAAQGAALGARDAAQDKRTILFVGDGSFQLTAQEVSTMIRHGLRVTVFLINNDGFTIERWIHGMDEAYNDISMWNYTAIPAAFGASEKQASSFVIKTKEELEKLLTDKTFNEAKGLQFVEVFMPREDAPRGLKITTEISARNIARTE